MHHPRLSPYGDTLLGRRGADIIRSSLVRTIVLQLSGTGLPVQEAALLHGAPALYAGPAAEVDVDVAAPALAGVANARRRQMRDVLRERVLRAHAAGIDRGCLAGFREGVVARVEILAFLEVLCQVVGFGGELAVEAEKALLVRREGLWMLFSEGCSTGWVGSGM